MKLWLVQTKNGWNTVVSAESSGEATKKVADAHNKHGHVFNLKKTSEIMVTVV